MDFNDNRPIYLQIAESVMDSIGRGTLGPGSRLASVREYAAETGVNPNTMMRTYNWLQTQGLIFMKRGIGYFVSADAPERIAEMRRRQFFDHEMGYFFRRLATFGVNPDELGGLYGGWLEKEGRE